MKRSAIVSACVIGLSVLVGIVFANRAVVPADTVDVTNTGNLWASAPGWSRGQQNLPLGYEECVRRLSPALQAEGYRVDNASGDFAVGIKDPHTAVVICSPLSASNTLVHIVVASNGDRGGRERQCLQAQMEKPGKYNECGSSSGGGNTFASPTGTRWHYQDGNFGDNQVFFDNGTALSEGNRDAKATWKVEGTDLVIRWWNGWSNRYPWNPSSPRLSGVAISPTGEQHSITLTRQ